MPCFAILNYNAINKMKWWIKSSPTMNVLRLSASPLWISRDPYKLAVGLGVEPTKAHPPWMLALPASILPVTHASDFELLLRLLPYLYSP